MSVHPYARATYANTLAGIAHVSSRARPDRSTRLAQYLIRAVKCHGSGQHESCEGPQNQVCRPLPKYHTRSAAQQLFKAIYSYIPGHKYGSDGGVDPGPKIQPGSRCRRRECLAHATTQSARSCFLAWKEPRPEEEASCHEALTIFRGNGAPQFSRSPSISAPGFGHCNASTQRGGFGFAQISKHRGTLRTSEFFCDR
jgi:hypothetical protein